MAIPLSELEQISPPGFEIPSYLKKNAIRKEQQANGGKYLPKRWNDRGTVIEYRGTNILRAQADLIKKVDINSKPDEAGYDSIAYFVDEFILDGVFVEFKSTYEGVQDYKQKIRDKLPLEKRNMNGVKEYLTGNDLVLTNCNDAKSPEEILNDSFLPQVKRIEAKRLADSMSKLLTKRVIQIWPTVPEAKFTNLTA